MERITDAALCEAVSRASKGLVDADLGDGVIKQRVARPGAGKSGGYRTLIFFRAGTRAVFCLRVCQE
ncbi:type II toxin-antitoxin system RelE/ParE family toxin [Acidisphaera sp. S103]|uniref:type II toxin-antitoxin system RelE/ParE family toxin n=1 Tax=Acidisphaera sp. S103 TaxID=1747223 RepID=UPI0020B11C5B|nr:type II toxin-antitoxin system RelE/ParE family toxin [Acidisphaera sp. S103]